MSTALDFDAVKTRQQVTWASGDYGAVAALIHPISELLVTAADLSAGARVLDVATGSGNAAIAAARCGCVVTGVDYVPELLERGRQRAAAERLAVTFVTGDAERLTHPDGSFDAVLSVVGVMFAPDQQRAAAELVRVCRPGGTVALVSWTPQGFIGELFRTVARHVPPPPGLRPPVEWGDEARVRELLGEAVGDLRAVRREFVFRFGTPEEFANFFRANYGPTLKAFEALPEERRPHLHADLVELARTHNRATDGTVRIPAEYLEVVAQRLTNSN
ncbi:class I SAM-dependent methyltransferase [Micromonospora sp. NPDC049204]|uniref:class I SAM-dependent methyltransferase n=1 Tax=Micromonospora sp. NPDC049204 TaxID=3154351 RepID=UPI00340AECF5